MIYLDITRGLNHIGRLGENEHRTLRFGESAEVLAMYPGAAVTVLHRRPGDPAAYPVAPGYVQIQNGVVHWTIQSGDLTQVGRGKCELIFTVGDVIAKSLIYDTMIDQALDGSGNPPEPWESWIEEVVAAGEHAPQIINGVWWVWSTAQEAYINTGVNATGPQGPQGPAGQDGSDYVITSADYDAIAGEVATRQAIQEKVDAAEAAADLSRGYADGKHLNGTVNPLLSENNGKFFAQEAEAAKEAIEDMTAVAVTLPAGSAATVTKTVDPVTGAVTLSFGVPKGVDGTGQVNDVQVNGTSVLVDGVANLPIASRYDLGLVKVLDTAGILITANGTLMINIATAENVKTGNTMNKPITPVHQHEAAYFGLSKAAGVDLANETVTVGTYTESAKSAIHEMLNSSVSVTGTTPSITALPGVEYVCGEVATLDITLPASGCIDVTFVSGSTATVLTVTPPTGVTISWPDGFDPTALDANTTYELNIKNGLAVVGKWA